MSAGHMRRPHATERLGGEGGPRRRGCLCPCSLDSFLLFLIGATHLEDYDESQSGRQNGPVLFGKLVWVGGPWRFSVIFKPVLKRNVV